MLVFMHNIFCCKYLRIRFKDNENFSQIPYSQDCAKCHVYIVIMKILIVKKKRGISIPRVEENNKSCQNVKNNEKTNNCLQNVT